MVKTTSKAKYGLRKSIETVTAESILDISDHIESSAIAVEELPIELNIADSIHYDELVTDYKLGEKLVASFTDEEV